MYIVKNAFRNIMRSKGRNLLIGSIAFVIGLSACLALSIKEAAQNEQEEGLANLAITATIGIDRQGMMEGHEFADTEDGDTKNDLKSKMAEMQSLSLSEMKTYAKASSVKDFYYTSSTSLNSSDIEAISTTSSQNDENMPTGKNKMMENQGDFTLTGYSDYDAMTSFVDGSAEITSGTVFEEDSEALECIIHQELATLNNLALGDSITFTNPENEEDTFSVKIVGIYTSATSSESGFMNMNMMDPANQIYMSYEALSSIIKQSSTNTANEADETMLSMKVNGTYVFENVSKYEAFEEEVRTLGLSDDYAVSSSDITAYERSLQPLQNLSKYAMYFLIVILVIGSIILIVLNIYRVRERKYEIGVLAAIGMKKRKIALQFITEIFVTTLFAIIVGTGIGAISAVPLTNTLLSTHSVTSTNDFNSGMGNRDEGGIPSDNSSRNAKQENNYIAEISSATDIKVVLELIGIAVLLTLISGGVAVLSILRFEPLKILSNRE